MIIKIDFIKFLKNNNIHTKTKNKKQKEIKIKVKKAESSDELVQEVRESLEDYKKGRYVKGDVKDIMKAIREYQDETN